MKSFLYYSLLQFLYILSSSQRLPHNMDLIQVYMYVQLMQLCKAVFLKWRNSLQWFNFVTKFSFAELQIKFMSNNVD